ncbi:MAG: methyltransferase domain-containing protein [Chloroflexota bacterium]
MFTAPTLRFSNRAENYIKYRPSYPQAVAGLLQNACGLTADSIVADIGSGTGILSKLLLETGCTLYGVEPNPEMRTAGEEFLAGYENFRSVNGTAESTTLPTHSTDIIVAGQAFHWFQPRPARAEFERILKPGGWVALIWNERLENTPFLVAYEKLLQIYGTDYEQTQHRNVDAAAMRAFYGNPSIQRKTFANRQTFDWQGMLGRALSSSYVPAPEHPNHTAFVVALKAIFDQFQNEGQVAIEYETVVYYGQLVTGVTWDAADYARASLAQQAWARELIAKLNLAGSERVLDLGCGDGKVTVELARLAASVVGVDNSPQMIALAQATHRADNLCFMQGDARQLPFTGEFDVVFSNAALHWVKDHAPVLDGICRALVPSGRILLQMGGNGNAAQVVAVVDEIRAGPQWVAFFDGFEFPYGFYAPEEYRPWLLAAGLTPLRVELIPKDTVHAGRPAFEGWFRTTWLPYTQRIPEAQRGAFITEVVDAFLERNPPVNGEVHVQMVRLEVEAQRT